MSDSVVVDANLALKWVLLEADSHTSILLLDKWTDEGTTLIAPALFAYEVTNILYRQTASGKLTNDETSRGLEKMFSLDIRLTVSMNEAVSTQPMKSAQLLHLPASHDARLFEVYLFELKSVTVANTQGIVRAFRNRPGDYLLVLTDDYQRLDFVLAERYTAELSRSQPQETFSMNPSVPKQVGIRPRVLTVNRHNPDDVALRVLRRFSYTESDTFAQYDKLLSAYDVAEWSEPFFNNRALFSDYYLTTRLPDSPEWKNATEAGAMTRAFREHRGLYG